MLRAQRAAYDALLDDADAAAAAMREGPDYPTLEEALARTALQLLGPEATVQRDPHGRGGVVAYAAGRSVDLTLRELVRGCIAAMGSEVSRLWA